MLWFRYSFLVTFLFFSKLIYGQSDKFLEIYSTILNKSCALGGCHDGSFEPNFTSIMSSYNTLVFHPVVKNNREEQFKYRVKPFDPANSILFERITNCCFVDEDDRMPFYDKDGLTTKEIALIKGWIQEGAPDIYGRQVNKVVSTPYPTKIKVFIHHHLERTSKQIVTYKKNSYDEAIGLSLRKNRYYIVNIALNKSSPTHVESISDSKLTVVNTKGDIVSSFPMTYDSLNNTIQARISTKTLESNTLYSFQLSNPSINSMHYPNLSTPYHLKAPWCFYLE